MERKTLTKQDFCRNLFSRHLRKNEEERVIGATSDPRLDETPCNGGPKLRISKDRDKILNYSVRCNKKSLEKNYVCSLTNEPCVTRRIKIHGSDVPSGDYAYAEVSYFYQRKCPGFNSSLE